VNLITERSPEKSHSSRAAPGLEYRVVYETINAADYGIPQRRERIFFVGFRADLGVEWSFPSATHSRDSLLWEQRKSGEYWERNRIADGRRWLPPKHRERIRKLDNRSSLKAWMTVRDAISGLPDPKKSPRKSELFHNHVFRPGARIYRGHTGSHLDDAAKTLKAGVHGAPGGENMLRFPNGSVRYFTVREFARLQTFPDSFLISGNWSQMTRQLGNAVPVDLASIIARSIKAELAAKIAS